MGGVVVVLFLAGEGGKEDAAEKDDGDKRHDEKRRIDVHGKEGTSVFSLARCGRGWGVGSGADIDWCSDGDEVPDFVDFRVGDGDAAEGPVVEAVGCADGAFAVGQAVDHDSSAGGDAEFQGAGAVLGVGVGDVQGFVVVALGVAGVDGVVALGGEAVAFTLLGGQAALAEGDLVGADDRACGEELEGVVVFEDEDGVGAGGGWMRQRSAG